MAPPTKIWSSSEKFQRKAAKKSIQTTKDLGIAKTQRHASAKKGFADTKKIIIIRLQSYIEVWDPLDSETAGPISCVSPGLVEIGADCYFNI